MRRDVRAHLWDYAVAVAMVGFAVVVLVTRIDVQGTDGYLVNPDTVSSWMLTIAVCAALAGRRRWPLRTLAVGVVLFAPLELAGQRDTVAFFALVIGLYSVAAHLPLRLAWRGVATIVALYATLIALGSMALRGGPEVGNLLLATAFTLGRMLRRARLRQEREADAARARAARAVETADLQAADERLRLAQELHDVVAHSLSVIAIQAGIGAHLVDRQPDDAARALDAIRATGDATSLELSRLVGVLREGSLADVGPAPVLTEITGLIDQIRTMAVPVTLRTEGDLAAVPAGVSLAAYRIVQEALTNVVRHAGPANATVTIGVIDDCVELCIDDDGRGVTASDPERRDHGHGLIGINERVQMYGGEARCGPRPGGGFRVQATLPYTAGPLAIEAVKHEVGSTMSPRADPTRRRIPPGLWNILLAGTTAAIAALEIVAPNPTIVAFTPMDLLGWTLRIGCCLTLVVRRRHPALAYATALLAVVALAIGDYEVGVLVFVLWIGLYTVASRTPTRSLVRTLGSTYGALVVIAWSKPPDLAAAGAVFIGILFMAPAIAGFVVQRDRRQRDADLSEHEADADAQARRARLVVANERLRIAEELNTIITRSIDTIALRAGTASNTVAMDPIASRATLEAISLISREALNDLRRLLKYMRSETEPTLYAPVAATLTVPAAGDAP